LIWLSKICLACKDSLAPLATQNASPPSHHPLQEGTIGTLLSYWESLPVTLHAQERMLPFLLMAEGVVSVGRQRVNMYYRNDPSEYSLI